MRALAFVLAAAAAFLPGCTPRNFAGLLPLAPAAPGFVADSPTPELRWQPLPANSRISDVVYDLKIFDNRQRAVLERDGLTEPRYRLERPLIPGLAYEWTVRARYRLDGARRKTDWAEREDTYIRDGYIRDRAQRFVPLTMP